MRKPTIYVAGPMRGYDNWNYDAFDRQAKALRNAGWEVINPAEFDRDLTQELVELNSFDFDPSVNYNDQEFLRKALARDLDLICKECTAIYMMIGWENSKGAKAEFALAKALGIDIFYEVPLPKQSKNVLSPYTEIVGKLT